MHLIDAYILLASNRTLLWTLLFLLIPGFGLFVASLYLMRENLRWRRRCGRSLPFNWKRLAILLNLATLGLLLASALLVRNALPPQEKRKEGSRDRLERVDVPALDEAIRAGRKAARDRLE